MQPSKCLYMIMMQQELIHLGLMWPHNCKRNIMLCPSLCLFVVDQNLKRISKIHPVIICCSCYLHSSASSVPQPWENKTLDFIITCLLGALMYVFPILTWISWSSIETIVGHSNPMYPISLSTHFWDYH